MKDGLFPNSVYGGTDNSGGGGGGWSGWKNAKEQGGGKNKRERS